ncbi:MAG: YlbF family regulator, partial [Nitrospinota bacterium]
QQCQQSLLRKQQNGMSISQEEIITLRRLQEQVQRNPTVMRYVQTRQQAQTFLSQVNLEISQLLGFDFGNLVRPGCC